MSRSRLWSVLVCGLVFALGIVSCSESTQEGESGSLSLQLTIGGDVDIDEVDWLITGGDMDAMSGTINTSAPGATASVEVFGLPPTVGQDYTIVMEADGSDGTTCRGSEDFGIDVGEVTEIMVFLNCKRPQRLGAVRVNGKFNICAELVKATASPLETSVGNDIDLTSQAEDAENNPIDYSWSGTGGSIADPDAASTTYTCQEAGDHTITISVTDNDEYCDMATWTFDVTCVLGEVECNVDDDCDAGEVCVDNACVPDVECNVDDDCDAGEVCVDNACVPDVECNVDDDCDAGDICVDNECVSDPDIFCDEGLCSEDADLKETCEDVFLLCLGGEPNEEQCIGVALLVCQEPGCGINDVCDAGEICVDGECVPDEGGDDPCNVGECVEDPDKKMFCEVAFAACQFIPFPEPKKACEDAAVADACFL